MNARYIVIDKVGDQWYDGVLYDLQFTTPLGPGQTTFTDQIPHFKADTLGIVYSLPLSDLTLAHIEVTFDDGLTQTLQIVNEPVTTTNGLSATRLTWNRPRYVESIRVTGEGGLTLHGVALIDQSSGAFQSFVLAPEGRFKLAHSGDVKIYENVDALRVPRAFVANEARLATNDDEATKLMRGVDFDPSQAVVLIGDQGSAIKEPAKQSSQLVIPSHLHRAADAAQVSCHLVTYEPEHVAIDVTASQDGYLVLTDAYYPGWTATVDRQPAAVERADIMFRAVKVPAGKHRVELRYEPSSFRIGMWITIGAWVILIVGLASTNRLWRSESANR